jgi:hypothetical protein
VIPVPRLVRNRTLSDLEEAVFLLRDQLAEANPQMIRDSAAFGCCGCGAWVADVVTPVGPNLRYGEHYCWSCVDTHDIGEYTVLSRREG